VPLSGICSWGLRDLARRGTGLVLVVDSADAAGERLRDEAGKLAAVVSCPGTDTSAVARG